jgi:tellurite resistance protein
MADYKTLEYYVGDNYDFKVLKDEKGKKFGKLVNRNTNEEEKLNQKVLPENISNLVNVAKVVISAAWQDGKILQSEKDAFNEVFEHVDVTEEQELEIKNEMVNPTPIEELVKYIKTREEKMLVLETSLLLVIADNEFHPKEKAFIEYLVKEFKLDSADIAILYSILPERVKKYIVKEKLNEVLEIKADEIETLNKFVPSTKIIDASHGRVYTTFLNNWKNRSVRYRRTSVY